MNTINIMSSPNPKKPTDPVNQISKTQIQTEIWSSLKEIDPLYSSPQFNLLSEIVNIFGDVDFEKVKNDWDGLRVMSSKWDDVIKKLVDKHSDEFFKILGYVREMKKMMENSKIKYNYAKVSLSGWTNTISSLVKGESTQWKLKSIFYNEIISKLSKTQAIFEILQDCDNYLKHNQWYDAIDLWKAKASEHNAYDKEFRSFNILINVNLRFIKLDECISNSLIDGINRIMFFYDENVLRMKIKAWITFFINYYSKISIDLEMITPLKKFILIINQAVNYCIDKEIKMKFNEGNLDNQGNINKTQANASKWLEIEKDQNIKSLLYYIKCIKRYENPRVFTKFVDKLSNNLSTLLTTSTKIVSEEWLNLEAMWSKYDLESKTEKIKFLLFLQVPLLITTHSISKISSLIRNSPPIGNNDQRIQHDIEVTLFTQLQTLHKTINVKFDDLRANSDINPKNIKLNITSDYFQAEAIIRHKINEMSFINIDYLPIMYKIFYEFYLECNNNYKFKFTNIYNALTWYTGQLYAVYMNKIPTKSFFELSNFLNEYDSDIANFKFIVDITNQIDQLKKLWTFSFDTAFTEIMKIVKLWYTKYFDNTKLFLEKLKKDCVHQNLFSNVFDSWCKNNSDIIAKLGMDLQFHKYKKNYSSTLSDITSEVSSDTKIISKESNLSIINNYIGSFIVDVVWRTKPNENLYLLTRNYKLMELLTKYITSTQSWIIMSENFIYDIMKQQFSNAKMIATLEQVGVISFDNIGNATCNDNSALILITLTTFDKISSELVRLWIILKIEFSCLLFTVARNLIRTNYWLNEPQSTPEYFITSFENDFSMYNNWFQYNLNAREYSFIKKDYLIVVNNVFWECWRNMPANNINNHGVNLLIKDFEFIRAKWGDPFKIEDNNFLEGLYYFVNYANLVNCEDNKFDWAVNHYSHIQSFSDEFIAPIIRIRDNMRNKSNRNSRNIRPSLLNK